MKQITPSAHKLLAALFTAAMTAGAAQAQTTNIALNGTGILGVVATASDTTSGTSQNHIGTGSPGPISNINDGSLTTVADNFSGSNTVAAGTAGESFAGITFATPQTLRLGSNVTLYLNLFVDGGWFGVPGQNAGGAGTGTGGTLVASSLVDPHVQYTTNGTTWTTLSGGDGQLRVAVHRGYGGEHHEFSCPGDLHAQHGAGQHRGHPSDRHQRRKCQPAGRVYRRAGVAGQCGGA